MRFIYSLLWWLILPLVLVRVWLRGRKEPGYRKHIGERLGFYKEKPKRPMIWIHAVSLGETRAAEPLVRALLEEYEDDILLTHMTATGREAGRTLFGKNPRVRQSFLPYDTKWMTSRFLSFFQPRLGIFIETEMWPNLIAKCAENKIPTALVNARMSERSLRRAKYVAGLMSETAGKIDAVMAQTQADARRLQLYGAKNVFITGSIKFDISVPQNLIDAGHNLREKIGQRPVFLCASTREGEEIMLLDAFHLLNVPDALLLIVPRHPQRFDEVAKKISDRKISFVRKTQLRANNEKLSPDVKILLGDTMGEMFAYYACADAAFIGGSLLPLGGQNLIESFAVGTPAIIGEHTFNFTGISKNAVERNCAYRAKDANEVMRYANNLLTDEKTRKQMSENAHLFAQEQQGATKRTMDLLRTLLVKKNFSKR